jgi:hypothetical protein
VTILLKNGILVVVQGEDEIKLLIMYYNLTCLMFRSNHTNENNLIIYIKYISSFWIKLIIYRFRTNLIN